MVAVPQMTRSEVVCATKAGKKSQNDFSQTHRNGKHKIKTLSDLEFEQIDLSVNILQEQRSFTTFFAAHGCVVKHRFYVLHVKLTAKKSPVCRPAGSGRQDCTKNISVSLVVWCFSPTCCTSFDSQE